MMKELKTSKEILDVFKQEIVPQLLKEYELASKELNTKHDEFSDKCDVFLLKAQQRRHIINYRLLPRFIEKNKKDLEIFESYEFDECEYSEILSSIKKASNKYNDDQLLIMRTAYKIFILAGTGKVEKEIKAFSQKVDWIELELENECRELYKQIPYLMNLLKYVNIDNDYNNYGYMYEAINMIDKSQKIDILFEAKKRKLNNTDCLYLDNIKYALKNNCLDKLKAD